MTHNSLLPQDKTPAPSPTLIRFASHTPSHDAWLRFVTAKHMHLSEIVTWLRETYQAEFGVGTQYWWIQFPDSDVRQQFELTWL